MQRKFDELGRIPIPPEMRDALGAPAGELMDIRLKNGSIVLSPASPRCRLCGETHYLYEIEPVGCLCRNCIMAVAAAVAGDRLK